MHKENGLFMTCRIGSTFKCCKGGVWYHRILTCRCCSSLYWASTRIPYEDTWSSFCAWLSRSVDVPYNVAWRFGLLANQSRRSICDLSALTNYCSSLLDPRCEVLNCVAVEENHFLVRLFFPFCHCSLVKCSCFTYRNTGAFVPYFVCTLDIFRLL